MGVQSFHSQQFADRQRVIKLSSYSTLGELEIQASGVFGGYSLETNCAYLTL